MPHAGPREELLELYRIAIDEYRFEVKLNWDRTMYYIIFNTGLISIATGLLKLNDLPITFILIAAIYGIGVISCLIGVVAIRKGHEYYRRTIVKKTILEELLDLRSPLSEYEIPHSLAIGTTVGQGEHLQVLNDTERWLRRGLRRGSITSLIRVFLILLAAVNAIGAAGAAWTYFESRRAIPGNSIGLIPVSVFAQRSK